MALGDRVCLTRLGLVETDRQHSQPGPAILIGELLELGQFVHA